ncbi:MAG: ATP-binding cassette domain-containing protein, partial [Lachnospiraceae bacterium]
EIITAAKQAACHEFILSLPEGYQTIVGEGGRTLSGGEQQRISIVRALLKDAPVVLLDEATASLDSQNEILRQQALNVLVKDKTVVLIAHRLRSIQHADQIIVLSEGQVSEQGTHEELLTKSPLYKKLWTEQEKAGRWKFGAAG